MNVYKILVGSIFAGASVMVSFMTISSFTVPAALWVIVTIGSLWFGTKLMYEGIDDD